MMKSFAGRIRKTCEMWDALYPSKISSQSSLAVVQATEVPFLGHNLPGTVRILASHFFSRSPQAEHLAEAAEVTLDMNLCTDPAASLLRPPLTWCLKVAGKGGDPLITET